MKFIIIIYVFFAYPDLNLDTQEFYNKIIANAFDQYAFVGIKYEITPDYNTASLIIDPCVSSEYFDEVDMYGNKVIGTTASNLHRNPFLYGVPKIELSDEINDKDLEPVLKHELFHFLTPNSYHSIDSLSLMFPIYGYSNKTLTRHDSLYLLNIFKF